MRSSSIPWVRRFPVPLSRLEKEMTDIVERMWGPRGEWWPVSSGFTPETNVAESDTGLEVTVDLPGLKQGDFHVELHDGELWISGEKKEEKEEQDNTYHRIERHYGQFRRVIPLPKSVDKEKVDAKYSDGVLTVTIPKTEEAQPKHIEIHN